MKIYQITHSNNGHLLYPTPVKKSEKFLISAPSANYAEILKQCLDHNYLPSPFEKTHPFRQTQLHADGETVIYELDEEQFVLNFLTERHPAEKILSKKILTLMQATTPDDRRNSKKELEHRYQTQIKCSECQKAGIASIQLQNWIKEL